MNPSKAKQCSHPQCHCLVPGTTPYCSDWCSTAAPDAPCQCGHDACVHETRPATSAADPATLRRPA